MRTDAKLPKGCLCKTAASSTKKKTRTDANLPAGFVKKSEDFLSVVISSFVRPAREEAGNAWILEIHIHELLVVCR